MNFIFYKILVKWGQQMLFFTDKEPAAPDIESLSKPHGQDFTPCLPPPWPRSSHYAGVFRKIPLGFGDS